MLKEHTMILGFCTNPYIMKTLEYNELPLLMSIPTRDITFTEQTKSIPLGEACGPIEEAEYTVKKGSAIYLTEINGVLYWVNSISDSTFLLFPIAEDALEPDFIYLCKDQEHMQIVEQVQALHERVKARFLENIDIFIRDFQGFSKAELKDSSRFDYCLTTNYFDQYMIGQDHIPVNIGVFFPRNFNTIPPVEFSLSVDSLKVNAFSFHGMSEDIYHVCAHLESCHAGIIEREGKDMAEGIVEADIVHSDEELTLLTDLETDETWGQIPPEGE
jgi:hypothetical protein